MNSDVTERSLEIQKWQLVVAVVGVLVTILGYSVNNTFLMAFSFVMALSLLALLPRFFRIERKEDNWKRRIDALVDLELQYKSSTNPSLRETIGGLYKGSLEKCFGFAVAEGNTRLMEYFSNKIKQYESSSQE